MVFAFAGDSTMTKFLGIVIYDTLISAILYIKKAFHRKGAFQKMAHTIAEIQATVARLAKEYGAERVYLFGSYARGDMTEGSDIDLRIDKGSIRGLELAGLLCDLEDALGTSVDLIPTGGLDPKFLSAIQNDEVLLYEAS